MRSRRYKSVSFLAGLALCAADGGGAAAADVIVVSGERRPQDAAATPASITRVDDDALRRIGADHASEIFARVPGVLIHRGSGQEHLTAIRSPVLTGGAGAGSFLFLENGVPLRSAGFANVNALFEAHTEIASAVEVVRGPGGAFYGANAIHGAINVLTPAPTEDLAGYLDISGDTIGRVKGAAVVSDTLGAHGFFVGVSLLDDPGYRADSGADAQKATLRHDYKSGALAVSTIASFNNLNQETAGFVIGPGAYRDPVLRKSNPNPEAFRDARSARISSRIDYQASDDVEISVTPFARWTDMAFLMHFVPSQALEENSHWSIGAQSAVYAALSPRVSLAGGVDWEYTEGDLREVQSIPTVFSYTQGVHYDYSVKALSAAPFFQAKFALTPRLTAIAAARLDWTRYDYDNLTASGVVGRFLRPPDRRDGFVTASPKASILYDIAGGGAFVSYARGARPPQTTDLYRLQINQTADGAGPEFIDAFEAGWKGPIGERIDLEVAAYFMDKRNFFFRDADGFNVDNGKTRHVGAEASVTARLLDTLTLDANASYGVHTYRFTRPILSLPNATEAIAFGDDVDTAPRWLAGARALWEPAWAPLAAELEWVFVDGYFTDAANTETYPGHHIVNLRGAWRIGGHLTLTATARNLFDTFYAERADFAFGEERYFPGEERTISVGLRAAL